MTSLLSQLTGDGSPRWPTRSLERGRLILRSSRSGGTRSRRERRYVSCRLGRAEEADAREQAPVDHVLAARDVAALVACEKGDERGDVVRCAAPWDGQTPEHGVV